MSFALINDLVGNPEEREFMITTVNGDEKKIAVKPLTVDELHNCVIEANKIAKEQKIKDEATINKLVNYLQICHSVTNPKLNLDAIKTLDYGIFMQILDIINKINVADPTK